MGVLKKILLLVIFIHCSIYACLVYGKDLPGLLAIFKNS